MAGCARSEIVRCGEVGVYHCWARCVRRAFLCGTDPLTGRNYEHRRDWLHQLQGQLAGLFGVEIAFHAEMGNHAHLVLRTRPDVVQEWSDEDVVIRWLKIAKLKRGSQDGAWEPTAARVRQELADADRVRRFRKRLVSVSWFMGAVCENIARRANLEDHCRGAFWESRFSSRDLADESAILACGIYVDLNQIRAGEAVTPEESRHTSAYDRIEGLKARLFPSDQVGAAIDMVLRRDRWLCVLTLDERTESDEDRSGGIGRWRASEKGLLPIRLEDYLELLDWTGRNVREDKRGSIPAHLAPILERLHINANNWLATIREFESGFGRVVGRVQKISQAAQRLGRRWLYGMNQAAQAFT